MRNALKNIFWSLVGCAIFFAVQAAVGDKVETDPPDAAGKCLPADEGERVMLWLERDQFGGLALHCEHHQVLGYGMTPAPALTHDDPEEDAVPAFGNHETATGTVSVDIRNGQRIVTHRLK